MESLTVNRRCSNSTNFTDSVNPHALSKDRVTINVGGFRHETLLSTLRVVPDSRLAWIAEHASSQANYDPETEYFFDRHPGVFANVLNYYRTGKLHCPGEVCGPLFQEELTFWGIDELQMEPCCWSNYTQHREAQETLKAFEKDPDEQDENPFAVDPHAPPRIQWKQRIWAMLEQPHSSKYAQILAFVSLVVIVLSVATFCMESMQYFKQHTSVFEGLEYFYCIVFTLDLVARALTCPDKLAFIKSFMTWVDLLSVIPLYISIAESEDIETIDFLFVLRLVRIFRLFRFFRTMSGMQVIGHTLRASARELLLLVLILTIPMVIFSTLVFYAERNHKDKDFTSIPETFWWAMITMTTVGYGDVYPKTLLGRLIGTFCACVGVLIVALPVSVIGSNFTLFYSHAQAQLKLPQKKRKPILLGAAGALVSETTLFNPDANQEISETAPESVSGTGGKSMELTPLRSRRMPSITPRRSTAFPKMMKALSSLSCSDPNLPESPPEKAVPVEEAVKPPTSAHSISTGLICASDVMLQLSGPTHRRMAISPMISPRTRRRSRRRKRRNAEVDGHALDDSQDKKERDSCCTNTDPDSPGEYAKRFSDDSVADGKKSNNDGDEAPESDKPAASRMLPRATSMPRVFDAGSFPVADRWDELRGGKASKDKQGDPRALLQYHHGTFGTAPQNERLPYEPSRRNYPLQPSTYDHLPTTYIPNTGINSKVSSNGTLGDLDDPGGSLQKALSNNSLNKADMRTGIPDPLRRDVYKQGIDSGLFDPREHAGRASKMTALPSLHAI